MSGNNGQVNGVNNGQPRRYKLLEEGEHIDDLNIPWLERFTTFCQRVSFEPNWIGEFNNTAAGNEAWTARLKVNEHMLNVTGQGRTLQEAKAQLVRQLEELQHKFLHRPLHPEYTPFANGNAHVNGGPAHANGI
ncbi:hypothetical protein ACGC1H_002767 [Rhizoctonia solani]